MSIVKPATPAADSLQVRLLLQEVTGGAALSTNLAANTKKQRVAHTIFVAVIVVLILSGVAVGVYLAVKSITHIDGSAKNSPNNNTPPYLPPPAGPTDNGGIPLKGPGSGKGCYPTSPTSAYMPDGCTEEPNPDGPRWQWGKLDISASQPPYEEQGGCGGSCGNSAQNIGVKNTPNPISQVLVCPPGAVKDVTPATAPYTLTNPYPHPVMVRSLAFEGGGQGGESFNGVDATSKDGDWACYWNTEFDPTTGTLRPGALPALIPPGGTAPLSYGFDAGKVTSETQTEAAALAFIIPMCTNHGPAWKQISGAYPPCQDTSPLAKFVGGIRSLAHKAGDWMSKEGKDLWNDIKGGAEELGEALENAGHDEWSHLAKTSGVITTLKKNIKTLQGILGTDVSGVSGVSGAGGAGGAALARMQLSLRDDIKHGLASAAHWIEKQTCICGDPLLPSNPGCPHFWSLHSNIAPSTGSYFAFPKGVVNADPIPQPPNATAVEFPTNQKVMIDAHAMTEDLKKGTVAQFLQAQKTKFVVQPLFPPLQPQTPFRAATWDSASRWAAQLPTCSEAGLTK